MFTACPAAGVGSSSLAAIRSTAARLALVAVALSVPVLTSACGGGGQPTAHASTATHHAGAFTVSKAACYA